MKTGLFDMSGIIGRMPPPMAKENRPQRMYSLPRDFAIFAGDNDRSVRAFSKEARSDIPGALGEDEFLRECKSDIETDIGSIDLTIAALRKAIRDNTVHQTQLTPADREQILASLEDALHERCQLLRDLSINRLLRERNLSKLRFCATMFGVRSILPQR